MDEIQTRLQETSQNCLKAFTEWVDKKQDKKAQEELHAAIHDLRKVSSRLEIELAISEREHLTSKPLPIPSHRSSNKNSSAPVLDTVIMEEPAAPVVKTTTTRRRRAPRPQTGDSK